MKLALDKYYTPEHIVNFCINKLHQIIGEENIAEYLEPSAGDGAFTDHEYLENKPLLAYDIEPKYDYGDIIKANFLKLNIEYKKGRCSIGNPPFGRCMNLAQKFYKKCCECGDYVAFILPIGQLNNTKSLYEFDLIYSFDLGEQYYTDRKLHCCFNIYKRPENGILNQKQITKLKDINITRQDSIKYKNEPFHIRMCYWGNGSAGKILDYYENYSAEYKIYINNIDLYDKIVKTLTEVNWKERLNKVAMLKIQQFHIIDLLREKIPEIH